MGVTQGSCGGAGGIVEPEVKSKKKDKQGSSKSERRGSYLFVLLALRVNAVAKHQRWQNVKRKQYHTESFI